MKRKLLRCSAAILSLAGGCLQSLEAEVASTAGANPAPDPSQSEILLPAENGWEASLVLDNKGVPLWTVEPADVFESHGCPEVVGLDDKGHAHICVSYSGKWTPTSLIADPKWLGGFAHGDIDPRIAGAETYVGAQSGNLYQVVAWPNLVLDYRLIASLSGREIHTLAAGRLDPASPEPVVVAFTVPGGVYAVTPTGPHGTFEWKHLGDYVGRVRQALVLPHREGETPTLVTASRNGRLDLLQIANGQLKWENVYETEMGMGRVAMRPENPGQPLVLYSTLDDGRILRHERTGTNAWGHQVIYHGPQGPRGVVAGQFDADPAVETIAICGYSKRVELLSRRENGWQAETIFNDLEKGHWLAAAELDGRNETREIIATGYGGRIVLLARPAGFDTLAVGPKPSAAHRADFSTCAVGSLPSGWLATMTGQGNPAWSIADIPSGNAKVLKQSGTADYPLCVFTNAAFQDGSVETRFQPISGEKDQVGGVVWRYRDAENYYVCRANALENNVVLYKVENGKRSALDIVGRVGGYGVTTPVMKQAWHRLRVDFAGSRHKVRFNGQLLFEVEDRTFPEAGSVGLWTKADSITLFDEFSFQPLPR
jgi:hypothetical protein